MISRLTDGLEFHSQALVLRAERQRLIAGNIANADTPGYQARDFNFAEALRSANAASGQAVKLGEQRLGDGIGRGIAGSVMRGADAPLSPAAGYALPSQTNLDSNSVDMDRERASSADNTVKYEATLRFINGHVRTALDAMKSHNAG